jgi:hypothetical protein
MDKCREILEKAETVCCGVVRKSERSRKPSITVLKKIAKLVNKPMGYFFGE